MIISPAKQIRGSISLPGDKSISHRAAMIAALADGVSRLTNYSTSADCAATLSCLGQLGVRIERNDAEILIHGAGQNGLQAPLKELDCGNSGTTMRLLAGILAGQNLGATLTGDQSLRSRPMQRIIEPLEMMGAQVSSHDGRAPLTILGRPPLAAIDYELLIASAQVKSCILLAGLNADGKTTVIENEVTRDHTERMLPLFGVKIETGNKDEHRRFARVTGPAKLAAHDVAIPGDVSSAAYFIAAAILLGSSLEISNVGVNPTRLLFLKILATLGLMEVTNLPQETNEPVGTVQVQGVAQSPAWDGLESPLKFEGLDIPLLIDELPLLAVVGSQVRGGIEIRDAEELRSKESDRIASTVTNLRAMGAEVEEFRDGLRVSGSTKLQGARIDPRGDHRIAMAFSVAALIAEGESEINDAECVAVSFPEFFELLDSIAER
ncbi:MAG TPA: 3-phosphoshikimate 1-carboxyvinyltransferase [Pyrinomonadaceae bacterium]|nr:3-phosphoshikimate 1-carboxyvinyltransferase [Pyrinomonadaceae bacterium]